MEKVLVELQKEQDLTPYYESIAQLERDGIDLKDFLATLLKMNLFSQKKIDLFSEMENSSKVIPTSSYQFRSQEDRRSDYKREHRFHPSDRFGGDNERPRRDYSASSAANKGGSFGPYRDKPTPAMSLDAQHTQVATPPSSEGASANSLTRQNYDTLVKPTLPAASHPYRDRSDARRTPDAADRPYRDSYKKAGTGDRFYDNPKSEDPKKDYQFPKRTKTLMKQRTDAPARSASEPGIASASEVVKKKYPPKKKTIYAGPDQPRITITEK